MLRQQFFHLRKYLIMRNELTPRGLRLAFLNGSEKGRLVFDECRKSFLDERRSVAAFGGGDIRQAGERFIGDPNCCHGRFPEWLR